MSTVFVDFWSSADEISILTQASSAKDDMKLVYVYNYVRYENKQQRCLGEQSLFHPYCDAGKKEK